METMQSLDLGKELSSFFPVLSKILTITSGPVMELGTGIHSTPFLHWTCFSQKRELVSYENNIEYFKIFQEYQFGLHKVLFYDDFNKISIKKHFDIIFIDHMPQEDRGVQLKKFINDANFIVVHDVTKANFVGFSKYRFDSEAEINTSVFSNFVDVGSMKL